MLDKTIPANKSIIIIQRRMTQYRIPLFEQLRVRLAGAGVQLQVVSGTPSPAESQKQDAATLRWAIHAPCHYWRIRNINLVFQPIPEKVLKGNDLIIITQENSLIYNYWLLFRRKFVSTRIAFWGHGANFQRKAMGGLLDKFKQWTSGKVDWWFAYTRLSAEKVIQTGFPEHRVTILNNAIDTKALEEFRDSIHPSELIVLRQQIGFKGKYVGVFIGSLYAEKRLDFLFAAADEIKRALPEFEMVLIGDGPLNAVVREAVTKRTWIHWAGVRYGRQKALYAALGQIILNPGLVGLGILDSFALRIPLITTDCQIHSPEIAYLDSGRNGLMTPNTVTSFTESALMLLTNDTLRDSMADECGKDCKRYTLDQMVENFYNGILKAINLN